MNTNLQVWLARWETGTSEPVLVSSVREVEDGPAAFFAAGVVARSCTSGGRTSGGARGARGLHATNALVGGKEGVLVYALHSPWAAFIPRLRLRGGEVSHPAGDTPYRATEAVC